MKRLTLSPLVLAALCAFWVAVGYGLGRIGKGMAGEDAGEAAQRKAAVVSTLEPPAVTGQSEAEKAARGEVRAFVPGRPFPKGGAEKWLLGLRTGEVDFMDLGRIMGSIRQLGNLDAESAREVADALMSINARVDANVEGDETVALWEDSDVVLSFGLVAVLGIVAGEDPEGALAVLGSTEDVDEDFAASVWSDIARKAPDRVESLLAGLDAETLPLALSGVVRGLCGSDPEAAMALLAKYPGKDFEEVWEVAVNEMMANDPRRGVELAVAFADGGNGTASLAGAVSKWLDQDEGGARAWVENYEGPGRDLARARLLLRDAREDPRGAMEEYAALRARGGTGEELSGVAGEIAAGLAEGDVAAARNWVEALPQGPDQEVAARSLVFEWVQEDAPAASEWVAALPGEPARDSAAQVIAGEIAESDPAAAFAWAHSISDEASRSRVVNQVLRDWIEKDPAAAYAAAAAQAAARAAAE